MFLEQSLTMQLVQSGWGGQVARGMCGDLVVLEGRGCGSGGVLSLVGFP